MSRAKESAMAIALAFVAQGTAHVLLISFGIPLASAWHVLPFVVGGLAASVFARGALPAVLAAAPYAIIWLAIEVTMTPVVLRPAPHWMAREVGVPNIVVPVGHLLLAQSVLSITVGMALGAAACAWIAHRRTDRRARPRGDPTSDVE